VNLSASQVFTLDELWLIHAVIRHEAPGQKEMKFPYSNLDLNDLLAETILRCEEQGLKDAALTLTRGDCLAIDATVSVGMKDQYGKPIGKNILLKVFKARDMLSGGIVAMEANEPVPDDIHEVMTEWEANVAALQEAKKTRRKRSA